MPFKKSNKFADRGKDAEKAVQKVLEAWVAEDPVHREFNRLVDTKAAGRTIKAAAADFEYYALLNPSYERYYGLVEVKETEHEYRLVRDKVPQLPALRKRANAGGLCAVLVYHSTCVPQPYRRQGFMEPVAGASLRGPPGRPRRRPARVRVLTCPRSIATTVAGTSPPKASARCLYPVAWATTTSAPSATAPARSRALYSSKPQKPTASLGVPS
jgi:hypothetical protein